MTATVVAVAAGVAGLVTLRASRAARRVRGRLAAAAVGAPPGTSVGAPPGTAAGARLPAVPPAALVAGGAGAAVAVLTLGPGAVGLAAVAGAAAPLVVRRHRRARLRARRRSQLPHALERLAGALRSGSSLPVALGEAGRATPAPLGQELSALALGTAQGRPLVQVLDEWAHVHDDPGTRLAATALALATVVGAAPARAVDGVASTLRERLDLDAERRALGSQARTSALVLSAAPLAFALVLGMTDAAAAHFLLRTPAGWACLAAGLGLDALGAVWMARLSRGDGR